MTQVVGSVAHQHGKTGIPCKCELSAFLTARMHRAIKGVEDRYRISVRTSQCAALPSRQPKRGKKRKGWKVRSNLATCYVRIPCSIQGNRGGDGNRRSCDTLFIRIRPTVSEKDERLIRDGAAGGTVGQARGCQTSLPCSCHAVSIGQKPNKTGHNRPRPRPYTTGAGLLPMHEAQACAGAVALAVDDEVSGDCDSV